MYGEDRNAMKTFNYSYCRWLEELAEAQKRCERVAGQVLHGDREGDVPSMELIEQYQHAHDALRTVANRFPARRPGAAIG
jgi:hypothetical protein